jgi:hypothetical protein
VGALSLVDTLAPANPPVPTGARIVRPLDDAERDDDEPKTKAETIRAALRAHPDGLDLDQLSKLTGIPRTTIGANVAALISGKCATWSSNERGKRVYHYASEPSRPYTGPRDENPESRSLPAAEPQVSSPALQPEESSIDAPAAEPPVESTDVDSMLCALAEKLLADLFAYCAKHSDPVLKGKARRARLALELRGEMEEVET